MLVVLPDGSSEYVMSQRDAVDIVRRMCGDDLAGILERVDWERKYEEYFACLEETENLEIASNEFAALCDTLLAPLKEDIASIEKKVRGQGPELEKLSVDLKKLEAGVKAGLESFMSKAYNAAEGFYSVDIPKREQIYR